MRDLATNKKAFFDYEIIESFEAGIVLLGTEVKSVKEGKINLKDSYVKIMNGEVFLINCHISEYKYGNITNHDPTRSRKLLLKKTQIGKLAGKTKEKGFALIPLKVYKKNNLIKIEIALAKGKKNYDKRETLKRKDIDREIRRSFKEKY
jgi:SsrA-binding protein